MREQIVGAFLAAKSENVRYSKRAFAKRLGISHGALIEIMSGRRQFSARMAKRLSEKLLLNPRQMALIFDQKLPPMESLVLKEDEFQLIADWCHYAIMSLIKVEKRNHSAEWLAKRLALPVSQVTEAIDRLKRLGLIRQMKSGLLTRVERRLNTSDGIASLSIRLYHRLMLEEAAKKLESVPTDRRDFSSFTMAVNSRKLPSAIKLIREFQEKLAALLQDERVDEVYVFNSQLIPLTETGRPQ